MNRGPDQNANTDMRKRQGKDCPSYESNLQQINRLSDAGTKISALLGGNVSSNSSVLQLLEEPEEQRKTSNQTGIPDGLKEQFEAVSGYSFDDVKVHYNSDKPLQVQALAYTRGNQVYIGPGQERYLSHELGHVVQQKDGIVRPTTVVAGLPVNDDPGLEQQADSMVQRKASHRLPEMGVRSKCIQRYRINGIVTRFLNRHVQGVCPVDNKMFQRPWGLVPRNTVIRHPQNEISDHVEQYRYDEFERTHSVPNDTVIDLDIIDYISGPVVASSGYHGVKMTVSNNMITHLEGTQAGSRADFTARQTRIGPRKQRERDQATSAAARNANDSTITGIFSMFAEKKSLILGGETAEQALKLAKTKTIRDAKNELKELADCRNSLQAAFEGWCSMLGETYTKVYEKVPETGSCFDEDHIKQLFSETQWRKNLYEYVSGNIVILNDHYEQVELTSEDPEYLLSLLYEDEDQRIVAELFSSVREQCGVLCLMAAGLKDLNRKCMLQSYEKELFDSNIKNAYAYIAASLNE